ncbi:MAG TPA: Hsp20/alpha crystallin family protein [Spirochaetia bacterium]|nr:Hsp20/alpha crystallin family protein [Spirochaetia bacterium]
MSNPDFHEPEQYLDDIADDFTDVTNPAPSDSPRVWLPSVDLKQTSRTYVMEADLPGMTTKDIEVRIADDKITLSGSKDETKKSSDGEFMRRERYARTFRRTFRLPTDVDQKKIDAELEGGVLTVKMPRVKDPEKVEERSVKITTG